MAAKEFIAKRRAFIVAILGAITEQRLTLIDALARSQVMVAASDLELAPSSGGTLSVLSELDNSTTLLAAPAVQTAAIISDEIRIRVSTHTTYRYIDHPLRFPWARAGGTWRDVNNVAQGGAPFATANVTHYGVSELSFEVTSMMSMMLADNAGFLVRVQAGTGTTAVATAQNPTYPGPRLEISMTSGKVVNCPLLVAKRVNDAPMSATMTPIFIARFDVRGIPLAQVKSAALRMTTVSQTGLQTLGVMYIDTPLILDDLSEQVKRPNEATAADELTVDGKRYVHSWKDRRHTIAAGWIPPNYVNNISEVPTPRTSHFRGDGSLHVYMKPVKTSGTAMHIEWRLPADRAHYADGATPNPLECYTGYMLTLGEDTGDIDGYKLPGMNSHWADNKDGLGYKGSSTRLGHTAASTMHTNHLRLHSYIWTPAHFTSSRYGVARYATINGRPFLSRKGQPYYLLQHQRLNTFTGSKPNADGLYELYQDDVLVDRWEHCILRTDPRVTIYEVLEVIFMHGGMPRTTHGATYIMGPVLATSKFSSRDFYERTFRL